ncbi:unnamed protein product [Caenorhabditis nigoni]
MNCNEDDYDLDDLLIPKKRMRMEKEPSPYSNIDRKSLCESIEQKLLTGELKEKKLDDNFTEIYDSVKVWKMRYSKCRKLVSIGPGSHKTHHKRGLCTETSKQPKKPILGRQQKSLNECIVRYMMESGSSFHQLESSPFRKLIHRVVNVVSPDIDTSNLRLPSGEWIRGQLEQRYDDLLKEISLETVELLVEAGSKFGIQKDELLKLRVVGDGAANIQKLGKFFKSCNVCSCHAIQKSAERVLDPLKDSRKHLDSDEQKHLDGISMGIEICANISSRIRRIKGKGNLSKLPTMFVPTRWLKFLYACRDVIDLHHELILVDDQTIQNLLVSLAPEKPKLITMISLLEKFEKPLKRFEETSVKVHEVAPIMFSLRDYFEEQENQGRISKDYTVQYIKNELKNLQVGNQSLQSIKNNFIDDFYDDPSPVPDSEREIEDYEKMSVSTEERNLCPLIFWNRHNGRYPKLSKLANSIFCVLSSESLCERAFSHLNRVFRPDRYNMEPVMIEKIMLSYMYLNNYT